MRRAAPCPVGIALVRVGYLGESDDREEVEPNEGVDPWPEGVTLS